MSRPRDIEAREAFAVEYVQSYPDVKKACEASGVPYTTASQWLRNNDIDLLDCIERNAMALRSQIVLNYAHRALRGSDRAAEFLLAAWDPKYDSRARAAEIQAKASIAGVLVESQALTLQDIKDILGNDIVEPEMVNDLARLGQLRDVEEND